MLRPARLLSALALALAPAAATAQNLPLAGMLPGSRQPGQAAASASSGSAAGAAEVGTWAEYRFRRGAEAPLRVRYSLVERSSEGDWLETQYLRGAGGADRLLVRVLVEGRIDRMTKRGRIRRVILQQGSMQALELPTNRGAEALPPTVPGGGPAQTIGTETLQVGERSVVTRHVRAREGPSVTDAWVSAEVPLWGLVRFSSRRYHLELLDFGTGARSGLVGEAVRFDPTQLGR
jgi:hypothetical protein